MCWDSQESCSWGLLQHQSFFSSFCEAPAWIAVICLSTGGSLVELIIRSIKSHILRTFLFKERNGFRRHGFCSGSCLRDFIPWRTGPVLGRERACHHEHNGCSLLGGTSEIEPQKGGRKGDFSNYLLLCQTLFCPCNPVV